MTSKPISEPDRDRDLRNLDPIFREKLIAVLAEMEALGTPFKLSEGFRTEKRQAWLFGQGRMSAPFGREGPKVTNANGITKLSNHQGTGEPGTGCAADCYPAGADGKIIWPPPSDSDARWELYARAAEKRGLVAGYRWKQPHDPPHIELRKARK